MQNIATQISFIMISLFFLFNTFFGLNKTGPAPRVIFALSYAMLCGLVTVAHFLVLAV